MGRKSKKDKEKHITFGISLHPETIKLIDEQSKKENLTKSKLIQIAINEYLKNNDKING